MRALETARKADPGSPEPRHEGRRLRNRHKKLGVLGVALLRFVVAAALLGVAVPSAAAAYVVSDGGGRTGTNTQKAGCSLDARLLRLEPGLCSDNRITADAGKSALGPAMSDAVERSNEAYSDRLAGIADLYLGQADSQPASSGDTHIAIDWLMIAFALAAGGVAGLIAGLRRGRPQALS